jgi:UTP--glucose-1-phosphate uridylyltransferase
MLPVVDKPVVQYLVEEAVASGIEEIIFVTGRGKRAIEDHFDVSYELEETLVEKNKHDLLAVVQKISTLGALFVCAPADSAGRWACAFAGGSHFVDDDEAVLIIFGDCIYDSVVPAAQTVD